MPDLRERLQPSLIDRYALECELGRGGMATVYRAHDLRYDRAVALKVLHPELASSLGPERFLREIRFAARLQHPHILTVYDSGETALDDVRLLWFTMPFVEGESLRGRIERDGRIRPDEAVRLACEVADALAYAHAHGVVHRDVKPENILLAGRPGVGECHTLVADFGVARSVGGGNETRLTETGLAIGTVVYMSPEQAGGERELDGRSDVYSLGCVVYEMLSGAPPFTGPTAMAVVTKHFMDDPKPLADTVPDLPAGTDDVVGRALAKAPESRFSGAADFAAALRNLSARATGHPNAGPAVAASAPPKTSLAVLDFLNLSADPAHSWLGSGIAETLQVDLQKIAGVTVASRDRTTRALRARGEAVRSPGEAAAVGRALGARWVVWGTFQAAGGRVRITPQCVVTETAETIATEKIDGAMEEIFALQDRVVTGLVRTLSIEISSTEAAKIARPETATLGAYESYAKGRQLFRGFGLAMFDQAQRCFEDALRVDPEYALAYSGLGSLHAFRFIAQTRREDLDAAVRHLERAVALDPDLAEPHQWLTYAYCRLERHEDAERAGLRATSLAPDSTHAHYMLAANRHIQGMRSGDRERLQGAAESYLHAVEVEPIGQTTYMGLGWLFVVDGQYEPARRLLDCAVLVERSGLSREMKFVGALALRAGLHLREGELVDADRLLSEALGRYPSADHVYAPAFTALSLALMGEAAYRRAEFDAAIGHYGRAADLAAQHPERLAMGHHLIRGRLGLARALHRLGMAREEAREAAVALALLERREGYSFEWMWTASDAESYYELARYYAATGRGAEAAAALDRAVSSGWADLPLLASDPDFTRYGSDPALEAVRAKALDGLRLSLPVDVRLLAGRLEGTLRAADRPTNVSGA